MCQRDSVEIELLEALHKQAIDWRIKKNRLHSAVRARVHQHHARDTPLLSALFITLRIIMYQRTLVSLRKLSTTAHTLPLLSLSPKFNFMIKNMIMHKRINNLAQHAVAGHKPRLDL